jgi:hypothetical protein
LKPKGHLGQGVDPKELAGEIELVTRLLRDGKSLTEVLSGLTPADEAADFHRSLRLAGVAFDGRRLLDEADNTNDPS